MDISREENHHADYRANIPIDMELQTGDWALHTGEQWLLEHEADEDDDDDDDDEFSPASVTRAFTEMRKQGLNDSEIVAIQKAKMMEMYGVVFR